MKKGYKKGYLTETELRDDQKKIDELTRFLESCDDLVREFHARTLATRIYLNFIKNV